MKIINIKFNFKLFILIICALIVILSIIFLTNIFSNSKIILNDENYISILKEIHDYPSKYIDKKIKMSGYVFRANDFNDNQFVTARDMIVSENDYRIIGFLCESENIKDYENNVWVEVLRNNKIKRLSWPYANCGSV